MRRRSRAASSCSAKQRHRLVAPRMDDMAIIDRLVVLAAGVRTSSLERHPMHAADKDVEAVVVPFSWAMPLLLRVGAIR